jgi:hypothetical protein
VTVSFQPWLAVVVAIALAACASTESEAPSVTVLPTDPIGYLESRVELPEGAHPLEAYDRYYARDRLGNSEVIRGVYLLRSAFGDGERSGMTPDVDRPGVFRGKPEDLPIVADGGCAVVSVYFDVQLYDFLMLHVEGSDQPLSPAVCNGLA